MFNDLQDHETWHEWFWAYVHWSIQNDQVGKFAFPPLPTHPQLILAVYPALSSLFGSLYPSETGIKLLHFILISNFHKRMKSQIFENFQNWISSKLLNPGFWYLICVFTWGTSLFMPNCVIVNVLEQHLCPKKQILVILRVFWAFFCWKTTLKGHIGIQNFAWWSSWASRTCMPNLMQFTKTVWL